MRPGTWRKCPKAAMMTTMSPTTRNPDPPPSPPPSEIQPDTTSSTDWATRCRDLLAAREQGSLLRQRQVVRPLEAVHVEIDGVRYVNFCSNNYLGLTHHPKLL